MHTNIESPSVKIDKWGYQRVRRIKVDRSA